MTRIALLLAGLAALPLTVHAQAIGGQDCRRTETGCSCTDGQTETLMTHQDVALLLSSMRATAAGDPTIRAQATRLQMQCGMPGPDDVDDDADGGAQ